ncbi:HAMP domain-containing histidine kinase [Oscillochloris sp. ZM17-4]|uniref:sensor histidine kinase n=1 Tax=Oscillochloris sp. ZM17-4 TaxID=2866714 RepID=UPI001C736BE4|nr:HAMP domain-containing sensor histidine kinase [Oscillochloris sp. ZM17-4]MBX0327566.1 HAMP domain-containing histidine kinase [Oscillochloris sp. ZM17-4]
MLNAKDSIQHSTFNIQHSTFTMPLTLRLSLTYLLLTLVGLLLLGAGFVTLAGGYLSGQRAQSLDAQAEIYAALIGELADSPQALQGLAAGGVGRELLPAGTAARLFSTGGALLSGEPALGPFPSRPALALVRPALPLPASQAADRSYTARAVTSGGQTIGVVELSRSSAEDQRLLSSLRALTIQAALAAGAVMALASLLVARSIASPILRQSRRAERLSHEFDTGPRQSGPPQRDEIGRLAASLDALESGLRAYTARIGELEQSRTRFYRSVSHDLRTPLTAISGTLENLIDSAPAEQQPALATLDAEARRLARLVDDLLRPPDDGRMLLSRRAQVHLAPLADEICALLAGRAHRAGVALRCLADDALSVSGDRDRLKQALLNLLDNALRATPPGGSVALTVARADGQAQISVADSGPGIPAALRAQIWERGVRGDSPGSSGLGLAIVREIVIAHGGEAYLDADHRPGARIVIELPLGRAEEPIP